MLISNKIHYFRNFFLQIYYFSAPKAFCDEKMKREAGVFATGLQGKCTIFDTKEE